MDIGSMNKRITFLKAEERENELAQNEQMLKEVKTVWASIVTTKGREIGRASCRERV